MRTRASKKTAQDSIILNILRHYKAVEREIETGRNMGYTGNLNPKLTLLLKAIEKLINSTGKDSEILALTPSSVGRNKKND